MAVAAVVSPPAVRARGVRKRFGRRLALAGVDLDAAPGSMTGIVGADGAGKSTLLRILAGVLAPDEGEVEILGVTVRRERDAERLRPRVGLLLQGLGQNLAPTLTVRESLDFFAQLAGLDRAAAESRREPLLETTRLAGFEGRRVAQLSGGMRQKLGLACVLLHEPELLLLDEPTTGVDPRARREIWELLSNLVAERGLAAVVATGDLSEVAHLDGATLLDHGQATARGSAISLLDLEPGVVASWPAGAAPPPQRIAADLDLPPRLVEVRGDRVRAFIRGGSIEECRLDPLLAGATLSKPDLEDVVVARFGAPSPASEASGRGAERSETEGVPRASAGALASEARGEVAERPGTQAAGPGCSSEPPASGAAIPRHLEPAIQARGLGRTFGAFVAADDVDLELSPGRILGLLGANGAGKTTVVKMLVGLLAPTHGTACVAGFDVVRDSAHVRRRIGYCSQLFSLHPDLTVLENLRLAAGIYGVPRRVRRARIDAAIAQADLDALRGALPPALPVGHRQRLAVACAILHEPAVLFLDEPTSGVDVAGRRRFWEIVVGLARERGTAVLLTTHAMAEAIRCDELVLMHAGRVVARGTPRSLVEAFAEQAGEAVTIPLREPRRALAVLRGLGHREATSRCDAVRFLSRQPEVDTASLRRHLAEAGIACGPASVSPPEMDDVFVGRIRALDAAADREAS